jgi:Uma2 family endonuclease
VVEHYRIEDYRRWQGDWELIQGIPLAMSPSPGVRHQRVARRLLRQLDEALDDCPRCEAFHGIDVELSDDTVTRPDVIVICFEPDGDRITRAPALIAEVVSPAPSISPAAGSSWILRASGHAKLDDGVEDLQEEHLYANRRMQRASLSFLSIM